MARVSPADLVRRYTDAKSARTSHESDWRLASAYCMPRHYNDWNSEGRASYTQSPSDAVKRIAFDSTALRSLPKYAAVLEHMSTPHKMTYYSLRANNPDLMRIRRVSSYFEEVTRMLLQKRYAASAGFIQAASEVYSSIGTYGTGPCYLGQRRPNAISRTPGFIYSAQPLRDMFMLTNEQGEVDTIIRRFFLNPRQFKQKFPELPLPKCMKLAKGGDARDNDFFEFIHIVHPRDDFDPGALGVERHPIVGSYLIVEDAAYLGEEEGYRSLPYLMPRTFTAAGDPYGFSPAQRVLPAMGTASAMKKTNLKQGQKAADPVLLAHDDGVMNGPIDGRPGSILYGGMDAQGRKLISTLPTGDFRVSEKLIQDERMDIEDSFFVFIFKLLEENREMTATEVMERAAKESALMSPTMGRLQTEWVAPSIDRELDLAEEMGLMPVMPPELVEAQGEYEISYTSPMAKAVYAEETSGFMRAVEVATNVANVTQDPSHLDHFDFDVAIPEMSSNMASPSRWMNSEEDVAAKREQRADQQQQQTLIENAGPLAGAAKVMQEGV